MEQSYVLEMYDISKRFGGVQALENVQLQVKPGEVHALMGENGAGKSTLMKILGGVYTPSGGKILINGQEAEIHNPIDAAGYGIGVIYQEQALVDSLTVADNILLGRIPNTVGWINKREQMNRAQAALDVVAPDIDLTAKISTLSVAKRQFVEIAKAISLNARIVVMDEPTSVLTMTETERLFSLIRKLKTEGISIIYISHRMEEVFTICDRCTVLKDGKYVATTNIADVDNLKIISLMTGRDVADIYPPRSNIAAGEEMLRVEHLQKPGVFEDISFEIHAGEIVGMYGLVGSGRSEVCRALMGIDYLKSGEIFHRGEKIEIKRPMDAIDKGIVYVSEDRKKDGLILRLSVGFNMSISTIRKYAKLGFVQKKQENEAIASMMKVLRVKASGTNQLVKDLSGGNQQKVLLAMWMLVGANVMIIDEPTRGVDIGTKIEIYKIIRELANNGTAIVVISSELPEVIGISDRILVMHQGKLSGEVKGEEATEEGVLLLATGGK